MSNSLILISICLSKLQLKVVTVRSATRDHVVNFNMSKKINQRLTILRIRLRLGVCLFLYETILEEDFWHSFLNSPVKEEINVWNFWWE